MSEFRRALQEKQTAAIARTPLDMEMIGWLIFGEDRISPTVLADPRSEPVYIYKKKTP